VENNLKTEKTKLSRVGEEEPYVPQFWGTLHLRYHPLFDAEILVRVRCTPIKLEKFYGLFMH
jgi:hypothetical protein